jgi:hypothetical protein
MSLANLATRRNSKPQFAIVPGDAPGSLVPNLADTSEEYADLLRRSEDLGREHQAAQADERRIARELTNAARQDEAERSRSILSDVLAGKLPRSRTNADALRAQHVEARQKIEDLDRAKRLLSEHTAQRRSEISAGICRQLAPEYKARVHAVATALLKAHQAQLDLDALTNELNAKDVAWVGALEPMSPTLLGAPYDNGSPLAFWLKRAAEAGYLEADQIPAGLR